jgi:hypothetical protein
MKNTAILFILSFTSLIISASNKAFVPEIWLQSENYTGSYQYNGEGVSLTLTLLQDAQNNLTGTLASNNQTQFSLEGMVAEGVATGVCYGNNYSVFFEAYLEGQVLTLGLIEPDEYNMPNYDAAQYIVFNKTGSSYNEAPYANRTNPTQQNYAPKQNQQTPPPNKGNTTKLSGEIVKDELNGFEFSKPSGWIHNFVDGQLLLGSNTIPGLITVVPHQSGNIHDMRNEMMQGLQEEGVYLSLSGNLGEMGSNIISGYYDGYVQGEVARGYGLGVLSPHGGGVFVLAVSTPDKLGNEIMAAANTIAKNTRFIKPSAGDASLVKHFAGEWMWSNGYRSEWLMFFPDGSFSDQYEAAYSGNFNDQGGNVTGNWGATNQEKNRGRWTIKGTRERGTIMIVYPNGNRQNYNYEVFVERGQKYYREYMINGYHYSKSKDY